VLVGTQKRAYGVIGFADEAREHAHSSVAALRDAGVRQVVMVDAERNLLAVRGPIPGAAGSLVIVKQARKE
jgi:ribosomal protein L3